MRTRHEVKANRVIAAFSMVKPPMDHANVKFMLIRRALRREKAIKGRFAMISCLPLYDSLELEEI